MMCTGREKNFQKREVLRILHFLVIQIFLKNNIN
jgi:hypothetical protein